MSHVLGRTAAAVAIAAVAIATVPGVASANEAGTNGNARPTGNTMPAVPAGTNRPIEPTVTHHLR